MEVERTAAATVQFRDITLRDAAEKEGASFSVDHRLKICHKLDEPRINLMESG